MSTDLADLYVAILTHPADDTPRLMYADELDAIGGKQNAARARLIRLTIERGRSAGWDWFRKDARDGGWATKTLLRNWTGYIKTLPLLNSDGTARGIYNDTLRREHAVRTWYWPTFTTDQLLMRQGLGDQLYCSLCFRRGFFSHVRCNWPFWRDYGDVIVARDPIASVEMTTWPTWKFDGENGGSSFGAALDGRFRRDQLRGGDHGRRDIAERLLRGEWPTVHGWTLPALDAP